MDLPSCIRSKPWLISASLSLCVIRSSILILPSMYQSTIFGTSRRPLAPPNAVPFHTRPVTSWNGRVLISWPAPDADDHRHPPAFVAALERLAHHLDVADAFEAVVRAALGQVHQVRDQVLAGFLRVDEMGHAELLGKRLARRIQIHADDHVCAGHPRALHDVEPDAAEAEYHHVGARL